MVNAVRLNDNMRCSGVNLCPSYAEMVIQM